MNDGLKWYHYLTVFVFLGGCVYGLHCAMETERAKEAAKPCIDYADTSMQHLPARCFRYFADGGR